MKKIFDTDRLFLREFMDSDYNDLCEILQDKDVMYAYEHTFSDEEIRSWYDRLMVDHYKMYGFGLWAVIHKDTNELLGQCGLTVQVLNGTGYLEIGYLFKKKYWRHGYATEAAMGCKKYAFDVLEADKVYSIIRENNTASIKVAKRIGMEKGAEIMKHYYGMDMLHYIFEVKNEVKPSKLVFYL